MRTLILVVSALVMVSSPAPGRPGSPQEAGPSANLAAFDQAVAKLQTCGGLARREFRRRPKTTFDAHLRGLYRSLEKALPEKNAAKQPEAQFQEHLGNFDRALASLRRDSAKSGRLLQTLIHRPKNSNPHWRPWHQALWKHLADHAAFQRIRPWLDRGHHDAMFRSSPEERLFWRDAFLIHLESGTREDRNRVLALQGIYDTTSASEQPELIRRLKSLRKGEPDGYLKSRIDILRARFGDANDYRKLVRNLSKMIREEAAKGDKANLATLLGYEERLADLLLGKRDYLNAALTHMDYLDILLPNFEERRVDQIPQAWLTKTQTQFYSLACCASRLERGELALYAFERSLHYAGDFLEWGHEDADLSAMRKLEAYSVLRKAWKAGERKPGSCEAKPEFFAKEKAALAELRKEASRRRKAATKKPSGSPKPEK